MAVAKKSKKTTKTPSDMRSFKVYPGEKPFMKARISHQTFYWLIIGMLALGLGVWIVYLTMKVQAIYDRVDMITLTTDR